MIKLTISVFPNGDYSEDEFIFEIGVFEEWDNFILTWLENFPNALITIVGYDKENDK